MILPYTSHARKATVKCRMKTSNLFCNIAAKQVEKQCCTFRHSTFKPVLQQLRLLQVAWILTCDWIKLQGSHVVLGSYLKCLLQNKFALGQ